MNILQKEEAKVSGKNKNKENEYNYINLKDSEVKLLIVNYFIQLKDKSEKLSVIIAVPKFVDKYYFKLYGNVYSPLYQIVDGSTYNNSTSNSKEHSVTLKTMFMPIRIYRKVTNLKTTNDISVKGIYYMARIFNKMVPAMKYILAKYGLYKAFDMLGINCIYLSKEKPEFDEEAQMISFVKNGIYINVPKMVFDSDHCVQSLVATIYNAIGKHTEFEQLFNSTFWIESLSGEFITFPTLEKGLSVLDSLEGIYDLSTKESIKLPEEEKHDVYHILRWMIREFSNLKVKDNLDISTKKIRCAEYIAALYAMRISKGIYRIADSGKKSTIETIKRAIYTHPMWLIGAITKCSLINYKNMVNDLDSVLVLKYTYKGTAGLGEGAGKSIPNIYRTIHPSHLGRVDIDSSSNTDPGITGTICPLVKLSGNSFSDYEEPNYWINEFNFVMDNYKAISGMKDVIEFKKNICGNIDSDEEEIISECKDIAKQLINPIIICKNIIDPIYVEDYIEEDDYFRED